MAAVVVNKEKITSQINKNISEEKKNKNQQEKKPMKKHDNTYTYRPFAILFGKKDEEESADASTEKK